MEQQKSLNAINYAKTDQAQVGQHNDDMLRAQTFKNETEARAQMGQRFDMDTEAVDNAIQQAKVNGGFSANKQVYAARQLAKTGTGYNNLEQVHATVAGISGNNKAMADSLIGSINSDTKGAGRFDLAAGFGTHQGLYKATLAHNQAENAFSSAQAAHQSGQLSNADFQVATANAQVADAEYAEHIKQGYVSAVKGTGTIEMLRSKPIAQDNVMPALSEALYDARNTAANDHAGYNAEGQSLQLLAQEEAGRLSTVVENYKQSTAYASPQVAQKFDDNAYIPTTSERREVKQESSMVSPNAVTYDRVTGQPSIQYERRDSTPVYDTSGAVVRDASGAPVRNIVRDASGAPVREVLVDRQGTPIPLANPNYREDVANGVNEQSSRPLFPPGDPRNPS